MSILPKLFILHFLFQSLGEFSTSNVLLSNLYFRPNWLGMKGVPFEFDFKPTCVVMGHRIRCVT